MSNESEFKAAQDLIYATRGGLAVEGVPIAIVPDGYDVTVLERLLPKPKRTIGTCHLQSVDAFIDYVKSFRGPATRIFADGTLNTLRAVFDFPTPEAAAWCDHAAIYTAAASAEWTMFLQHNKREMGQDTFAIFIEDNIRHFQDPSGGNHGGAYLLEIAKSLHGHKDVKWRKAINLDSGDVQFQYDEDTSARTGSNKGAVELPRSFTVLLRPFNRGVAYPIVARLRYRLNDGLLLLRYELIEPQRYVEDAFNDLVEKVEVDTDLAPLYGTASFGNPAIKE